MAIYRLDVKVHSRGKTGKSSLAIASYRSEEKLKDEKLNSIFDYSKKNLCFHSEILLPSVASEKLKDRGLLWNAVEKAEKRKDAQLCREVVVALPKELNLSTHKEIVRDFCQKNFVKKGMICDIAVHNQKDGNNNFHAHILLSTREIDGVNFGKKNRSWNTKELLIDWRKSWAETVNNELKNYDELARVDHRTLKAQKEAFSAILPSNNNNTYRKFKNDVPRYSGRPRKNESTGKNVIKSPRLLHQKLRREEFASLLRQSFTELQRRLKTAIIRAIRRRKEREVEVRERQAEAGKREIEIREREAREGQAEVRERQIREVEAEVRERQAEYREQQSKSRKREARKREDGEARKREVEARNRQVEARQREDKKTNNEYASIHSRLSDKIPRFTKKIRGTEKERIDTNKKRGPRF